MKQTYQTAAVSQGLKTVNSFHRGRTQRVIFAKAKLHIEVDPGSKKQPKRKKFAFPTPGNMCSTKEAFLCKTDRVLSLYNKRHGGEQKRVTSPVRDWFELEARQAGWAQVTFLADIQESRSAGYMLRAPSQTEVRNVISR